MARQKENNRLAPIDEGLTGMREMRSTQEITDIGGPPAALGSRPRRGQKTNFTSSRKITFYWRASGSVYAALLACAFFEFFFLFLRGLRGCGRG